jgi:cytochrome c-type biogenesis protein CcmH/NrfG
MFDDEMTDDELRGMLRRGEAPAAPARLRAAVFPEKRAPWWRRSVRVPAPIAACILVLLALGLWRAMTPRVVYREAPREYVTFREYQPVKELRPRIIRRGDVDN